MDFLKHTTLRHAATLAALLIATFLVVWFHRPDQIARSYVWVEDVAINIHAFHDHGWWSIFYPYPSYIGYFSLPSRLLFASEISLSFRWLPELGVAFAILFQGLVATAVALSPTRLHFPFLCAIAMLLIPTDAEAFGVSLYAGWWGSLLIILPLIWSDGDTAWQRIARIAFIVVGGLSSPLIVVFLPLYFARWFFERRSTNLIDFGVAAFVAATQAISLALHHSNSPSSGFDLAAVTGLIRKFFGYFLFAQNGVADGVATIAGIALLLFVVAASMARRSRLGPGYFMLLACLVLEIAAVCLRQGTASPLHPVTAGPRYFLLPFVTLAWILIELASSGPLVTRVGASAALIIMLVNFAFVPPHRHTPLDWRAQVDRCARTENYRLPFHADGAEKNIGYTITTVEECRSLIRNSLFDNKINDTIFRDSST